MQSDETRIIQVEILVEELSMQRALYYLVPRLLVEYPQITPSIRVFNGKPDLLKRLPERLRGYWRQPGIDWRILILIDEDRQDCKILKGNLEQQARHVGFYTKTDPDSAGKFQVVNRIAVEELEAWFFGDVQALCAAYPKLDPNLAAKRPYRNPDAIAGGTWEKLEIELQAKNYHPGGLEKLRAAEDIAQHMDPMRNESKSFQIFREGLLALIT